MVRCTQLILSLTLILGQFLKMVNLMRCPLWLEWPKMKGYFGHMHSMKIQIYSIIFCKYLLYFVEFLIAIFAFAVLFLAHRIQYRNYESEEQVLHFILFICNCFLLSPSAHRTPNFTNPDYFVCLLFEYFFQIKVLN